MSHYKAPGAVGKGNSLTITMYNRLRAMPEVEAASAVSYLPLANQLYMANSFKLDSGQSVARVVTNAVMADYFRVMGTDFLSGHDFKQATGPLADRQVVVNETVARLSGLGRGICWPACDQPLDSSALLN